MNKPKVENQGKVLVNITRNDGFIISFPDGTFKTGTTGRQTKAIIKAWCEKNGDKNAIRVCEITWTAPEWVKGL